MGPLAVMALATMNWAGCSCALLALPEDKIEALSPMISGGTGTAISAATALLVTYLVDRPGSIQPLVAASIGLGLHSGLTVYGALRAYRRGELDCLEPVMVPLLKLAKVQPIMVTLNK